MGEVIPFPGVNVTPDPQTLQWSTGRAPTGGEHLIGANTAHLVIVAPPEVLLAPGEQGNSLREWRKLSRHREDGWPRHPGHLTTLQILATKDVVQLTQGSCRDWIETQIGERILRATSISQALEFSIDPWERKLAQECHQYGIRLQRELDQAAIRE